uniref:Uncharacterized protein n=1 Tax=Lotus japonicus TaxID=34305 RepID=I3SRB9_LOTJA|nr:unknown [Lotus japonicus]
MLHLQAFWLKNLLYKQQPPELTGSRSFGCVPSSYVEHKPSEAGPLRKQHRNHHPLLLKAPHCCVNGSTKGLCTESHHLHSYSQRRK